jgi:hypothetical protein
LHRRFHDRGAPKLLHEECPSHAATILVVRANERGHRCTGRRQRGSIHPRVHGHHRNLRGIRLDYRRHDLLRAVRHQQDHLHLTLDQVLHDLHLAFNIDLPLGCLHHQLEAKAIGRGLRTGLHVDEELVVERLDHERDGRLGDSIARAIAGRHEHGDDQERQPQTQGSRTHAAYRRER